MVVRGILEAGPRTEPGGSKLIGQNEDLHPSTARQNHLLQYCLINYDVKLASLIPSSDIHPQKVSMEFVNPHENISAWHVPRLHCQTPPKEISKLRYASI